MADRRDPIEAGSRVRLQPFVRLQYDETRKRWVLQAPERVLVLDETGKEIIERCDGQTNVGQVVARLSGEYDAPPEVIEHDVLAVLRLLAEKGLLLVEEDAPDDADG